MTTHDAIRLSALLTLTGLAAAPALAQSGTDQAPTDLARPGRQITSSLTIGGRYIDEADMDDGGTVAVARVGANAKWNVPLGDQSSLSLNLGIEHSNYNFDNVFIISDTDNPVTQVNSYDLHARLMTPFDNGKMAWLVGGGVKLAGEFDADVSKSLTYNAMTGILYNYDPKISIGVGVVVATQLEDDPLIVPFPIIRYQFDDQWSLATEGPSLTLEYDFSQEWDFGMYVAWENRSYRLESGTGLSSDAVLNENRVPVGLFATFSPGPGIEIRADVFSSLYTKFEARADDESELGNDTADPSLGIGLSAIFKF